MRYITLLILSLLFFSGCTLYQINTEETTFDSYPAKLSKDEVAYLENVNVPHKVIGYVKINAEKNQKKDEIIDRLKEQAAELGGDAITNITTDSLTAQWATHWTLRIFTNANIRENYMADVVHYLTPEEIKKN